VISTHFYDLDLDRQTDRQTDDTMMSISDHTARSTISYYK